MVLRTEAGRARGQKPPSFHEELLIICTDPEIWRFALRRAGHHDLAEDAIQETYYSVSRVKDPEHVSDVRAFFCKALAREISHQRGQRTPVPVEAPDETAGPCQQSPFWAGAPHGTVEGDALWSVLARSWLTRFERERPQLEAMVAGRSPDPGHYRQVIVAVAEQILRAAAVGSVSWADGNDALQGRYPSWLCGQDCDLATRYQRLSRARQDIRQLLKVIVSRPDLSP